MANHATQLSNTQWLWYCQNGTVEKNYSNVNSGWYFNLEAMVCQLQLQGLRCCQRVIFSVRYGSYFNVTMHYLLAGWVYDSCS